MNLYFLIGLPRSGKSTIAKRWLNKEISINNHELVTPTYTPSEPRVVVCADQIRLACGHRWNSYVEGYVNACKDTMIQTLLNDHNVLVDGTHTTKKSITRLFELCEHAHYLYVDTPPSDCKARAIKSGQPDLIPIIDRMYKQLLNLAHVTIYDSVSRGIHDGVEEAKRNAWEQRIDD